MARYCGECGSSLGPDAFYSGTCPICGSRIDASDRVQDLSDISSADNPTQAAHDYVAPDQRPNRREVGRRSKETQTRESRSPIWVITVILALALLLAGAAIVTLAPNRGLSFFTSSNASANSSSGGTGTSTAASSATSVSGPGAVATTTATGQPGPTPPPGGSPAPSGTTPTAAVTPVPTAVSVPPQLAVSPRSISSLVCLGAIGSASITVANTGGGEMSWSASASHYSISPKSGTLGAGAGQTVSVTGIGQSGTITFTAAGTSNSPQQVSINCTL